jgi:hypothetical protein
MTASLPIGVLKLAGQSSTPLAHLEMKIAHIRTP